MFVKRARGGGGRAAGGRSEQGAQKWRRLNGVVQCRTIYLKKACNEGEGQHRLERLQGVLVAALQAVEGVGLVKGQLGSAARVAHACARTNTTNSAEALGH